MPRLLKLPVKWRDYLITQPETGMSYQAVTITLANGKSLSTSVLNCELAVVPDSGLDADIERIEVHRR